MSGIVPEQLIRTIRAVVQQEMQKNSRLNVSSIEGKGGNTTISSWGDIHIRTMSGFKAYYNGIEIGTASGGNADTVDNLHATAFMRKDAGAGDQTQNNNILMEADISMYSGNETHYYTSNDTYAGYEEATSAVVETNTHRGIAIMSSPFSGSATSIYVGDSAAQPAGVNGFFALSDGNTRIKGTNVQVWGPIVGQDSGGIYLSQVRLDNLSAAPSLDKGGVYYDTDDNNVYVNKGTLAVPSWQLMGGAVSSVFGRTGAVVAANNDYTWAQINKATSSLDDITTKTISTQLTSTLATGTAPFAITSTTKVTNLNVDTVDGVHLPGTIASVLSDHNKTNHDSLYIDAGTVDGYEGAEFARLAAENIFTGARQYIRGAGGSINLSPSLYMKNSTYGAAEAPVIYISDAGRLYIGYDTWVQGIWLSDNLQMNGWKIKNGGTDVTFGDDLSMLKAASTYGDIKNTGNVTPGVTDSKTSGSSSLYWSAVYGQAFYIDDASTKIDNNTGNMRFTVANTKKFEFVVS